MSERVSFPSNGHTLDGYLSLPAAGEGPGLLVIQEWWGLVPHIERVVDRFAAAGFVAMAPDLFHGQRTTEPDEAAKLMMGLEIPKVATDLAAAAEFLATSETTTGKGIGVVGFCMGGGLTMLAGSLSDHITAGSAFYPATPWPDYAPDWERYAGKQLIVHAAESDGGTAADNIQSAKKAIEAANGEVTLYDYPGSNHAFFNDDRPEVYDRDDADLAWRRTVDFFLQTIAL